MKSSRLTTVESVIDALGGDKVVAELTGRSANAVWNWRDRQAFPTKTLLIMQAALEARKLTAPTKLWGMPEAVDG